MLIALEGPDNAGKSWLAERLANELDDAEIRHWGPIREHPLVEYELPLQDYVPGGRSIICDRLHLGEAIYGPLYRNESRLDPISWFHIEAFLNSRGCVLVHLSEGLATLRARHASEGEDFLQLEHLPQVVDRYEEVVKLSAVGRKIDARTSDRDVVPTILQAGADEELSVALPYEVTEGRYIGPSLPTLLLVGEQRNLDERGFTSPFVPFKSTSGHYLFGTLIAAEVDLRGVGLINAVEDEHSLVELWERLQRPPVVSLGVIAHKILNQLELPHGAVPHPQYVRRFHNSSVRWYGRTIKHAWNHQDDLTGARP